MENSGFGYIDETYSANEELISQKKKEKQNDEHGRDYIYKSYFISKCIIYPLPSI